MDINKKPSKSNNTPLVLALIIIPILFIFGTMIVIAMVMTNNRPNIKITVSEATNIRGDAATLTLTVEGDRDKINEKGFVYGTAPNPKFETGSSGSNPFYEIFNGYNSYRDIGTYLALDNKANTGTIEGLYPNTKYYVKAYAITRSGIIYGNEVSFDTTKYINSFNEEDDLRRKDVNNILDEVLRLRNIRPDILNNRNGLAKNMRINGAGDCGFSTIRESDNILYGELAKIGYILPADPNPQSDGCSDYGISINNNIITITAPNAIYGPISVSSN
ncbi:MAG: hypothetical protein WD512_11835 [Candidatus Paceibacterota bacterium]